MPFINGRYVRHEPDPVEYATHEISDNLLDLEIAIRRAVTMDELFAIHLAVGTLTARAIQLQKLALDRADAWRA